MNKSRIEKVAVVFAALCSLLFAAAAPALAQTPPAGVRLQAAMAKEDVDGDLKSAIEMYQKIADDKSAPRDVRSRALLRLAGCYEKLGRQAQQVYRQVVRDFADQPAAAQARARLAALRQAPAGPATTTQRKIELPASDGPVQAKTDGRGEAYLDDDTGALVISDLRLAFARAQRAKTATSPPDAPTSCLMSSGSLVRIVAFCRRAVVTTTASTTSAVLLVPSSRPASCASVSPRGTTTHPVKKRRSWACCGDRLTWATTGAGTNGTTPISKRALCSAHARRSFLSAATRTAAS